jgi:hypothetical protein
MDPAIREPAMPNGTPESVYHANGIDPDGKYLQLPVPEKLLADVAVGDPIDPGALATLRERYEKKDAATFGVLGDRSSLASVGWGVLFAYDDNDRVPDLKKALAPLLERRKAQAGSGYYELDGARAYRAGESKTQFLKRFNLGPGTVDPAKLPYYLLIVGDRARSHSAFNICSMCSSRWVVFTSMPTMHTTHWRSMHSTPGASLRPRRKRSREC